MDKPRILLLSAYDADSHRYWRQQLEQGLSELCWQVLALPPRHFAWRVRGNPLSWSQSQQALLNEPYDLILATSMVDLATLRGLVPALGQVPAVVYFHENQFAYPDNGGSHGLLEAQMVSLYAALAADRVVFNSDYNRRTFLTGCGQLLDRLPDQVPAGVIERLEQRATVLPVPIGASTGLPARRTAAGEVLQVVWNHRWEYDKGPRELLQLVLALLANGTRFVMHVVGQQFRQQPAEFEQLRGVLQAAGALGEWGFIESREEYYQLLGRSDVVLSTALHDFQGLAMLEACAAGCTPVAPAALVYPEWVPPELLFESVAAGARMIDDLARRRAAGKVLPTVNVEQFTAAQLLPRYRELIHSQIRGNSVS